MILMFGLQLNQKKDDNKNNNTLSFMCSWSDQHDVVYSKREEEEKVRIRNDFNAGGCY